MDSSGVYIPMTAAGMTAVTTANSNARPSVRRTIIHTVFFNASAAFCGSFSRIPQYLDTSTEAPMPSPMQKI